MAAVPRPPLPVWLVVASMLVGSLTTVARAEGRTGSAREASPRPGSVRMHLDVDVRALRDSGLGDEVELGYALALATLAPSLLAEAEPLVAVDRVVCDVDASGAFACHLLGRFDARFVAQHRVAGDANRIELRVSALEAALASQPGGASREGAPIVVHGIACDGTHLVLELEGRSDSACASAVPNARPGVAVSLELEAPGAWPGVNGIAVSVAIGERVTMRTRLETPSEAAARWMAATVAGAIRNGTLPIPQLPGLAIQAEAPRVQGPSIELDASVAIPALRESLVTAFRNVTRAALANGRAEGDAAEPMAEIDDLESLVLPRERGASCTATADAVCDASTRIVGLESDEEDVQDVVYGEGEWTRQWAVTPDHQVGGLLHAAFGTNLDTHAYVESSLATAAGGRPCEAGCVLVASGTAAELAIELATAHPERFASVFLVGPVRVDPLPLLARIETLPSGVDVFVATVDSEYFASPAQARVRRAEAEAFARALKSLPSVGTRGRVLRGSVEKGIAWVTRTSEGPVTPAPRTPGRLRPLAEASDATEPRVRSALACRGGDAAACATLSDAWTQGSEAARVALDVRACALGHGPTCYETFYVPWAAFGPMLQRFAPHLASVLRQACRTGSGGACNDLGVAFEEHTFVPRSYALAVELYVQGCELGSPYACHNAVLRLAGPAPDDARRRALGERLRASLARPEIFAAIQADSSLDVASIAAFRDRRAPAGRSGGDDATH